MKLLIVGKEKEWSGSWKRLFLKEGYEVECTADEKSAEMSIALGTTDGILIDQEAAAFDGEQLIRKLRAGQCETPLLLLTPERDPEARIRGLNAGADCCLSTPCEKREVLACINALLRRQRGWKEEWSFGGTTLELSSGRLVCKDRAVRLSAREFEVMRLLLRAKGALVQKDEILERVWGCDSNAVENHVEVYVGFLRKRLRAIGSGVQIKAVRRMGYHLEPSAD